MIELFTDSGNWVYFISFFCAIIFIIFILFLIKNKYSKYKCIMNFLFLIPFAIGITGTLLGYHDIINALKTSDISLSVIFRAEDQVWNPFYLGLIFSSLLYIIGIVVWLKKRNS